MTKEMPKSTDYDNGAVYMERRALMYLREYLKCEGEFGGSVFVNIDTAHVAKRLHYAGILASFTGPEIVENEELGTRRERWDGHTSELSPLGEHLKEIALDMFSARSAFDMNFWTIRTVLDIWPLKWLEEASAHQHRQREMPSRHVITNFMAIFQMEFPLDASARQYLRDRIRLGLEAPIREVALPPQFVDVPVAVDRSEATLKRLSFEEDFSFGDGTATAIDDDGFPVAVITDEGTGSEQGERPVAVAVDLEEAADFDFGVDQELPDEEAGNQDQDQGGDEDDFPDEELPELSAEEEADGWKV